MKFVLNGGLIIGTVDGGIFYLYSANIEIGEETGPDNIFLFGTLTPDVENIRHQQIYVGKLSRDPKLESVISSIRLGNYGLGSIFEPLLQSLQNDYYLLHADFDAYIKTMDKVDKAFKDKSVWAEKSILAACSMGMFSSDRSIKEYAKRIWKVEPARLK
jgi:starch phosphorylase